MLDRGFFESTLPHLDVHEVCLVGLEIRQKIAKNRVGFALDLGLSVILGNICAQGGG